MGSIETLCCIIFGYLVDQSGAKQRSERNRGNDMLPSGAEIAAQRVAGLVLGARCSLDLARYGSKDLRESSRTQNEHFEGSRARGGFLPRARARSRGASIARRAWEGWRAEPPLSQGVNPKRREIAGFTDSNFFVEILLNYYGVRGRE